MLTFLTGTDISAKKEYIYNTISELISFEKKVYLVVPEQASFDRDREFLFRFGEKLSNRLVVTSFSRLCSGILEENGLRVKPEADDAARSVIMSLAVEDVSDSLEIYSRHAGRPSLTAGLLCEYGEIKQAGLTPADMEKVSGVLGGSLKRKTNELARIFSAYEARLGERFSDESDNIRVVSDFLGKNGYFEGAVLFFDDFRGFTAVQTQLLAQIFSQAENCYVSVALPKVPVTEPGSAFDHALRTQRRLRIAADKKSVRNRAVCTDTGELSLPVGMLRESFFSCAPEIYTDPTDRISVFRAADKYSECDGVAMEIRRLLSEEGYRCRDIAVVERGSSYASVMRSSLKKYGIPVFTDRRIPLVDYPLVRLVLSAVHIVAFGFSSEDIFMMIKTGIAGISDEDCALLENYVYMWQKDRTDWISDFNDNPDGFGVEFTDECRKKLVHINEIRKRVVVPLIRLKKALENGSDQCRAVYEHLISSEVNKHFCEYAEYLNAHGNEAEAVRCAAVWEQVIGSLDALNEAVAGRSVTPRRFFELLKIIFSSGDIGRIPAGCDEIVIGTADRTRYSSPRAVFILGANEGIFPASTQTGGLFSAKERRVLCENDFILDNLPENIYAEERSIAYSALNSASERLYVSYSVSTVAGTPLKPSEIVGELLRIFPHCVKINAEDIPSEKRIGSVATAFEEYAENYGGTTVYSASLEKFLSGIPDMSGRLGALARAAEKVPATFEDPANATELFGRDMYISASKAESYHKCPFMYFCKYGMSVKPHKTAGFDARVTGLLVHYVLEKILEKYTNSELTEMRDDEIEKELIALTEEYINEYMGGREDKSRSFNKSLDRAQDEIKEILFRLIEEFGTCSFVTKDVELEISDRGDVSPYKVNIPGGGCMTVYGIVDRVDVMESGGKAYLRVIDYKTGGKNFRLSDVFDGLNMQMLIYLMCLWDNAGERYGDIIPAGVLYVPAKSGGKNLGRSATPEEIGEQKKKNGKMNGIILESETVLRGMESAAKGIFLNAEIDKNGKLKGAFLSLSDFERLHKKIDAMLAQTGAALHRGDIAALPVLDGDYKDTCEYCDYNGVCLREENDPYRILSALKHKEAAELLRKEDAENG